MQDPGPGCVLWIAAALFISGYVAEALGLGMWQAALMWGLALLLVGAVVVVEFIQGD